MILLNRLLYISFILGLFLSYLVPVVGLEPTRLSATTSKIVMATLHHTGKSLSISFLKFCRADFLFARSTTFRQLQYLIDLLPQQPYLHSNLSRLECPYAFILFFL